MAKESMKNLESTISPTIITGDHLISFVSTGSASAVETLLRTQKINIDYINEYGDSAMAVAIGRNDDKMVQILIKYGAKIQEDDYKALIDCANKNCNKAMQEIIDNLSVDDKNDKSSFKIDL